jgi:TRADD-N domain-containing protein
LRFGGLVSTQNDVTSQARASCPDTPPSLDSSKECSTPNPSLDSSKECPTPKKAPWAARLLSVTLFVVAGTAAAGGGLLLMSHTGSWLALAAFVTSGFFFVSGVVVPLGIIRESNFERRVEAAYDKDCEDLNWALRAIEDHTLKGLAWVNFKQLRNFAFIAQRQARMSYYASLVAAAVSLLVLTSGTAVAIGLPTPAAKVAAGIVATTGTALSSFLASTFLTAYQIASRQMSYYYGQPLVHCYLLNAERLARDAGKAFGKGAELLLWQEVMGASIKASADAQDHLSSMQRSNSQGPRQKWSIRRLKLLRPDQAAQHPPLFDEVDSL